MNYTDNLPSNSTSTNKKSCLHAQTRQYKLAAKYRGKTCTAARISNLVLKKNARHQKSAKGHFRVASSLCFKARIDLTRRTTTIYNFELTSTELRRSRFTDTVRDLWLQHYAIKSNWTTFDLWRKQIKI